ncbi:MAG: FAD-dependent monooxygenase [Steroidobacteraceae bacterium]
MPHERGRGIEGRMPYDVVIAGGGPVGLFLACELRLAGVSVLVLEKMPDAHSPLKAGWMGMRGLNVPSTEAFYRRGLLEAVRSSSLGWLNPVASTPGPRFVGHFAGIMLDVNLVDFSKRKYLLPGPSAGGGLISLESLELLLAEHAASLGVELRRGIALTNFTQEESCVTIHAGDESFQTGWLVGCDGGRSTVRKLADFEFAGTEPEFTGYTAWVDIVDPEKLRPGFNLTDNGMYIMGPGPGRIGMVDFDEAAFDRTNTITLETLQNVLRRVSGTHVTLSAMHVASTYTDRARQATTYRKGRVLLAGDAAHVHSPLGGQGLNTGLADAMNLGWKLAATILGHAPKGLLDTYTEERHPAGAWALEWTRAQVSIMRPNPHARAIASVIRDLIQTREGTSYFAEKISGISLHYNLGGDHPLIGYSAPDFQFEDDTRLGNLLHDGKAVLLDFAGSKELHALAQTRSGLKYVSARAKDGTGFSALLIRPDGFVAWASESEPEMGSAAAAIQRWFG